MNRSVLVVRLDGAGDVLLISPAIRAIHASGDRVALLCSPSTSEVARCLPFVSRIMTFDCPWSFEGITNYSEVDETVEQIAKGGFDRAIVFSSFHQSPLPTALMLRMAAVPEIGAISPDFPGSLLDIRHRVPNDVHEVERNLSLAGQFGYQLPADDTGHLQINFDEQLNRSLPERYVVIHPGSSVPARNWDAENYRRLAKTFAENEISVVVTGSSEEFELARRISEIHESSINMAGLTSFQELAAIISRADAIVTGNTGPAHIAAAVNTPVVSIYAPTVPSVRWRPWKVPHVLLGDQEIDCAGCRARVCPKARQTCIADIPVKSVFDATCQLMKLRPKVAA